MKLKPYVVCPFSDCPYAKDNSENGICQGLNPDRDTEFNCLFMDSTDPNFNIEYKSNLDVTGNMKVLIE